MRTGQDVGRACIATLTVCILVVAMTATAQSPNGKDVPTIARETSSSVVRVVIRDQNGAELGSGSGFVASSDGKIVTNYHVVHVPGAVQAEARLTDGGSYQIEGVLATDPDKDLAVLKLQTVAREFRPLHLASTEQVQIDEHVIAIGSPLAGVAPVSTEATVSDGIVSGIRDWPEHRMQVLQITAPISPGSSGGALVNSNSDVIGVTLAYIVGGQNVNFAIPIAYVRSLLADGPMQSLASVNVSIREDHPKIEEIAPTGSYTGVWQSSQYEVSGAAQMTINIQEGVARAEIFLTGGESPRQP